MAHYAFLDENNIVTEVITGIDETETIEGLDTETWYGNFRGQTCKRTSYNVSHGKRIHPETGLLTEEPGFRKNYAGIGMSYSADLDAFIEVKPFESWILNEETCRYEAPSPNPTNMEVAYRWDESTLSWIPK